MKGNSINSPGGSLCKKRKDAYDDSVAELERDGQEKPTIGKLIKKLKQKYPGDDVIIKLSEMLHVGDKWDRNYKKFAHIDYIEEQNDDNGKSQKHLNVSSRSCKTMSEKTPKNIDKCASVDYYRAFRQIILSLLNIEEDAPENLFVGNTARQIDNKAENTILAVDKNQAVHERETEEWMRYGVNALRVDTMTEAIKLLVHKDDFLFVVINEDTVPDFILQLCIMRGVTGLPIFAITSNYSIEKKLKAMDYGVDVYDHFNSYNKNDVIGSLAFLKAKSRRENRSLKRLQILTGHDIILSPLHRNVFIKDLQVLLTRKEFDILYYLMVNREYVVSHAQLMKKIWTDKHEFEYKNVLWQTVDRLRRKLAQISPTREYIKVERGVGYRFSE